MGSPYIFVMGRLSQSSGEWLALSGSVRKGSLRGVGGVGVFSSLFCSREVLACAADISLAAILTITVSVMSP